MKRITTLLVVALAACRTVSSPTSGGTMPAPTPGDGATTPKAAVEALLAGAKAGDIQAMASVWGNEGGLNRNRMDRKEVETRMFIAQCVLKSDTQKIGEPVLGADRHMIVSAELTQGRNAGTIRFDLAPTPNARWLVSNFDISVLQHQGFCSQLKG
jgi:hypothetical protein